MMKYILLTLISSSLLVFGPSCKSIDVKSGTNKSQSKPSDHEHDHEGHNHDDDHGEVTDSGGHDDHAHEEVFTSVTRWESGLELFAEWGPLQAQSNVESVWHLTNLDSGDPVNSGSLEVQWLKGGNVFKSQKFMKVSRVGIFSGSLTTPEAGTYELVALYKNADETAPIAVDRVVVYSGAAPYIEEPETGNYISYLKEQQWMLGMRTAVVERQTISHSVSTLGEITSAGTNEAEVVAPFAGLLYPTLDGEIVIPGQNVRKGDALLRISPVPGAETDWVRLVGDYQLAQQEHSRVSELFKSGAVSQRRYDEAKVALRSTRAQMAAALGVAEERVDEFNLEGPQLTLRAPRSGVLTDVHLKYGQRVQAGEHLFNIVDASRVWIEAQVATSDLQPLGNVVDADFTEAGSSTTYRVSELGGKLVSANRILDPRTRRAPFIFSIENPEGRFRPGAYVRMHLLSDKQDSVIAVPHSALIDDDGTPVVYVQKGGESFEKRFVKTGVRDGKWVQILKGLDAGERVVIEGAYKVRLASTKINPEDAGHGHAH